MSPVLTLASGLVVLASTFCPRLTSLDRSIETYVYVSDAKLIGMFEGYRYLDLLHAAVSFMCFAVLAKPWCKTVRLH